MEIKRPLDFECTIGQGFGENANGSYAASGLAGHTGIDESCGYGSEIRAYADGVVFALHTPEKPAKDGYTAIYVLCHTPLEFFELAYGHVSRIDVKVGDRVTKGQVIGAEGNKGTVYQGGVRITLAMQKAGDKRGSHRHVQKRPLYRSKDLQPGREHLRNGNGTVFDEDGFYYYRAIPENGFAGCTNLAGDLWTRSMQFGSRGYDVYLLQKALVLQGFLPHDHQPTEFYGTLTQFAVAHFQRLTGISPALGFFGPKTRATLNAIYKTN